LTRAARPRVAVALLVGQELHSGAAPGDSGSYARGATDSYDRQTVAAWVGFAVMCGK